MEASDQLSSQLQSSQQRIQRLELDAEQQALVIVQDQSKHQEFVRLVNNEELVRAQRLIDDLRSELKELMQGVNSLMSTFRQVVKQESVDALDKRLSDWPTYEFTTREEFSQLVDKRLSSWQSRREADRRLVRSSSGAEEQGLGRG
jgi:hypothetical protein